MKNGDGEGNGANERQFKNAPLFVSPKSGSDRFGYALDRLERRRWRWRRFDRNNGRRGNFRAAIWAIAPAGFDLLAAVGTGWPAHTGRGNAEAVKTESGKGLSQCAAR